MANNYRVLYRKYRPSSFDDVVGQNNTIKLLKDSIIDCKISHAYIFSGPRGTGKTSTAKIFAKAINCLDINDGNPCNICENCVNFKNSNDIYEIDAASNNGVDQIRDIIDNIKLSPISSKYKVYIIDEVHMLSTSAFNALLLTLEEPPSHAIFILATTNIEEVPITVLSRCQRLDFKKISDDIIFNRLKEISSLENIDISDEALYEISSFSDGGLRDALSILDQLSKINKKIEIDDVLSNIGLVSTKYIEDLINDIENKAVDKIIDFIKKVKELSCDYQSLVKKIISVVTNRAIKVQKLEYKSSLSYNNYKDMCFELADTMYKANVHVDSFLLLELILIKYCNKNEIEICNNNAISDIRKDVEKKSDSKIKIKTQVSKNNNIASNKKYSDADVNINSYISRNNGIDNNIVDIRINNCFVQASKSSLQKFKLLYEDFVKNLVDKRLKGILEDSEVVLASDNIIVIKTDILDSASLINENLDLINDEFKRANKIDMKFVSVCYKRWQEEMDKFKENKLKGIAYVLKDEPTGDGNKSLVEDVFLKDIVEVK